MRQQQKHNLKPKQQRNEHFGLQFTLYSTCLIVSLFQFQVASSIRLNRNNLVVYAAIGETVNISCYFDPNMMVLTNNNNNNNNYGDDTYVPRSFQSNNVHQQRRRKRQQRFDPPVPGAIANHKRTHRTLSAAKSVPLDSEHKYFLPSQRISSEYDISSGVRMSPYGLPTSRHHGTHSLEEPESNSVKYELDWYFLDKQGRMNIISYGNKTIKDKYRTFIVSNYHHKHSAAVPAAADSSYSRNWHNSNPMMPPPPSPLSYSSSALYSQSVARSSSHVKIHTFYLSTLIESEDDEGVYQCINPDLPNFILRNVTVLIERNNASIQQSYRYRTLFCAILIHLYLFLCIR